MNRDEVTIRFQSQMYDTDEQIEIVARGTHSVKDGMHYVMYTEDGDGGQSVRNILKFDGDSLEVLKIGTTRTNMYYRQGHKHIDVYRTPHGEYDMCTDTERYVLASYEEKYEILIEYRLELGGAHVSRCKVEISIEQI